MEYPAFNVTLIVTSANVTRKLTNTEVKQAKASDKEYNLADGNGLYLRVKPSGSKIWIFNYSRPFTKKRANLSLGLYLNISLAEVRGEAKKIKAVLAKDIDPKDYRLDLHVFPNLGKIPLHRVNAVDTIEILTPLAKQGKFETINNLCGWINEIMVYAVNSGLITSNLLTGIGKAFDTPKSTNLLTLKPEELPELMAVLNRASIKIVTRCLIEWQLQTMVCPAEASGARWDEINIDKAQWVIPAERMKKRKPHTIPLTQQALAILEVLRPINGHREFVFSSDRSPRKPANSQTANMGH